MRNKGSGGVITSPISTFLRYTLPQALNPTGGDAWVFGNSIRSPGGMAAARSITGVCPQFDVLWPELTAREHLSLYAAIKGVPRVAIHRGGGAGGCTG